jgi:hypothetical protein
LISHQQLWDVPQNVLMVLTKDQALIVLQMLTNQNAPTVLQFKLLVAQHSVQMEINLVMQDAHPLLKNALMVVMDLNHVPLLVQMALNLLILVVIQSPQNVMMDLYLPLTVVHNYVLIELSPILPMDV